MLIVSTVDRVKMYRMRLWLVALTLQASLAAVSCAKHHRRSMANQAALPVSKGGWRPVVGSGGLLYGSLGTAPLHAPSYKLPVLDLYPSSARPLVARDATKLTSIAQSYRPTTLRTVPIPAPTSPANHPINSYLNPFALPNNGLTHYKFIQNFPVESVVIRNPHNPYAARPILQKYQTKPKQQYQNNVYQQLTNIQPIQFGQYPTAKPLDIFGNPVEVYVRPDAAKRPQSADTEIFKPEVFKLPDNDVAPQSVSQQVKTAQQQTYGGTQKFTGLPYAQYAFQDSLPNYQQFPPSILGTFGSFGIQSVKGRDPVFPTTRTTYLPPNPTKQTIFNSFNYIPNFKSTPTIFATTTPKLLTTPNQFIFGTTLNDLRTIPTAQTKVTSPPKIDPNLGNKGSFKPSPQDPFAKNIYNLDYNKITTYNPPIIQSTTEPNTYYHDYDQYTGQKNYNSKPIVDYRYEINNHKGNDNIGVNQQVSHQYANPPNSNFELEDTNNFSPYKGTYEVTENESDDIITHSLPGAWGITTDSNKNQKPTEETITKPGNTDTSFGRITTPAPVLSEEYAIVTESEKEYENSLNYDNQLESQSRRPLGDDFEPIVKQKLKDYYYKVSTPSYGEHSSRRTKKPTESSRVTQQDVTTTTVSLNKDANDLNVDALPTLPPNKHFKRPSPVESVDKDRVRKRNKIRRRRPPLANGNRFREENTTRKNIQSSTEEPPVTTEQEEIHTIRPRVRPSKSRTESSLTTPTITTDLTTSALPTISPTTPTIAKKKTSHRKPLTTTSEKLETTTQLLKDDDQNKESPIMKIATRPQFSRNTYEVKSSEVPDYTHKQDEKDTPTSDVSVSLSDTLKVTSDSLKDFSFHRDVRPVEITTTESLREVNEYGNDGTTTARTESSSRNTGKVQRPRLKNKYDRPRFSVKDYRNRLSSTTSTTDTPAETPKTRHPQRKNPYNENSNTNENENTTERKKFTPKDPRYKINRTENNEQGENVQTTKQPGRQRQTTIETESSTQKISSRIRNGQRRPRPTEEPVENSSPTTVYNKRPLRKKIKDSDIGESVQDITVTETPVNPDHRSDITSERSRSESAIMKIADKKHQDHLEHIFEHSKRVSDLTLAASKDYNTPGMFKTVSANSRRIPNYFTIATDDPILPIEAFFPQLNQKKES